MPMATQARGYSVTLRGDGGDPDDDFAYMASSAYFVPSGGTYSMLAALCVRQARHTHPSQMYQLNILRASPF